MRAVELGPFFGVVTSLDERYIDKLTAKDMLNFTVEDGSLRPRNGYSKTSSGAAQGGFTADYGCVYLAGQTSANAVVEEYITFENLGVSTRAYFRNVSTGSPTQVAATTRASADWVGFSWDQYGYFINPSETNPVFRRVIGTAASFVNIAKPAAPTTAMTVDYLKSATVGADYDRQTFAGVNVSTHITYTGNATSTNSSVNADGSIVIGHSAGLGLSQESSFSIDIGSAISNRDWQYNDVFAFTLSIPNTVFAINPDTIAVTLTNADGSPLAVTGDVKVYLPDLPVAGQTMYYIRVEFPNKTRANWDNIKHIKVEYQVTTRSGTATNNKLTMSRWWVGCCLLRKPNVNEVKYFSHTYYDSVNDQESGVGGSVGVDNQLLDGTFPIQLENTFAKGLGVWLKFTFATSGEAAVDNNRLYVADGIPPSATYRRIVTQSDATPTYTLKMSYQELANITDTYSPRPFQYTNCINAFTFKSRVCWLYSTTLSNVRFSRVGEPEKQADSTPFSNPENDENRGLTFTLADAATDTPVGGVEAGDAAIIFGNAGVHICAFTGPSQSDILPPKRVAGSVGVANKYSFCRFKTDTGTVGAAFLPRDPQSVYFVIPNTNPGATETSQIVDLTKFQRGLIQSFLLDGQTLTISDYRTKARIFVDETTDSLWVILHKRAMVLRRPAADGNRHWELYEYNTNSASILYPAPSVKYGLRCLMSDGNFVELERTSGVAITGTNRDDTRAMTAPYWTSKTFTGQNRRIFRFGIFRDTMTDTPSVQITSTRQTISYSTASGKHFTKIGALQQGEDHTFKITGTESGSAITRAIYYEGGVSRGWHH